MYFEILLVCNYMKVLSHVKFWIFVLFVFTLLTRSIIFQLCIVCGTSIKYWHNICCYVVSLTVLIQFRSECHYNGNWQILLHCNCMLLFYSMKALQVFLASAVKTFTLAFKILFKLYYIEWIWYWQDLFLTDSDYIKKFCDLCRVWW